MNVEKLKKVQGEITETIFEHAKELGYDSNVIEPITDGVCDFEGYLKSNPKVMWILKEPNGQFSNGEIESGGWSIVEDSFRNDIEGVAKQPTWQKITYVMYGYLNGCKYEDMDLIRNNHEMTKVMQSIAYLNVSKMPGRRQSSPDYIEWCYQQWKPVLQKQIETYAPDVIIFGNTFEHFRDDFEKKGLEELDGYPGWIDIYKSEGRLLFAAYHLRYREVATRDILIHSLMHSISITPKTKGTHETRKPRPSQASAFVLFTGRILLLCDILLLF